MESIRSMQFNEAKGWPDKRITLRNGLYPRVNVLIIAAGMSVTFLFFPIYFAGLPFPLSPFSLSLSLSFVLRPTQIIRS